MQYSRQIIIHYGESQKKWLNVTKGHIIFAFALTCTYSCPDGQGLLWWVCATYIVHHFNSTELCCAPSTCVVHDQPPVCTMVHKVHTVVLYKHTLWWCKMYTLYWQVMQMKFFQERYGLPPSFSVHQSSVCHYTKIQTTILVKRNELWTCWIKNFLRSPWKRQVNFEGSQLLILKMLGSVQSRHPSFRRATKISDLQHSDLTAL